MKDWLLFIVSIFLVGVNLLGIHYYNQVKDLRQEREELKREIQHLRRHIETPYKHDLELTT